MPIICTSLGRAGKPCSLIDYETIIFIFFENANLFSTFFIFFAQKNKITQKIKIKKRLTRFHFFQYFPKINISRPTQCIIRLPHFFTFRFLFLRRLFRRVQTSHLPYCGVYLFFAQVERASD